MTAQLSIIIYCPIHRWPSNHHVDKEFSILFLLFVHFLCNLFWSLNLVWYYTCLNFEKIVFTKIHIHVSKYYISFLKFIFTGILAECDVVFCGPSFQRLSFEMLCLLKDHVSWTNILLKYFGCTSIVKSPWNYTDCKTILCFI